MSVSDSVVRDIETEVKKEESKKDINDAKQSMTEAYDHLKQAAHSVKDAAHAAGVMTSNKAQDGVEAGKKKASELGNEVEKFVNEKPLMAMGAAFAAGWVVSRIMKKL